MTHAPLDDATARKRLVKRSDMVACKVAFIDCKMPGSQNKENYSLIGAGVTQSADQVVNITEPHGFSMGVAAMPPGTVNNLHVHYTAEVFMIYKGEWTFRWGAGRQGWRDRRPCRRRGQHPHLDLPRLHQLRQRGWLDLHRAGRRRHRRHHLASVDPVDGGAIRAVPHQRQHAGGHGNRGRQAAGRDLLQPIDRATVESFRRYTPEQMRKRVVTVADRQWSDSALLDSCLPGHAGARWRRCWATA